MTKENKVTVTPIDNTNTKLSEDVMKNLHNVYERIIKKKLLDIIKTLKIGEKLEIIQNISHQLKQFIIDNGCTLIPLLDSHNEQIGTLIVKVS